MAMTLETLRKLVNLDPNDPLSRFALGKKLLEVGETEGRRGREKLAEAEGHLRFSLNTDSSHLASYFNLARCLVQLGKYPDARPVILAGIERTAAVGEGMGRDLGPALQQMLAELPDVRLATPAEVVDLRHKVLLPTLAREASVFPGDELPTTLHGVAIAGGQVVGCGTMMFADHEGTPAWRLRGMASDPSYQSKGLGRHVLVMLEREAQARVETDLFWCNARVGAVRFYESHGWRVITPETYDIPHAGHHHTMIKRVT